MELREWLTIVPSWTALGLAGYSLYLTMRRDARDVAGKEPTADIVMGQCKGFGPWDVRIKFNNRLACRIDIEGVFLPELGPLRVIESRRQHKRVIRDWLGRKTVLAGTEGYNGLPAGGELLDMILIEPSNEKALTGPTKADFFILYRRHDDMGPVHRLKMRMIARL